VDGTGTLTPPPAAGVGVATRFAAGRSAWTGRARCVRTRDLGRVARRTVGDRPVARVDRRRAMFGARAFRTARVTTRGEPEGAVADG
jgi:hypothetical protein